MLVQFGTFFLVRMAFLKLAKIHVNKDQKTVISVDGRPIGVGESRVKLNY